MGLTAIIQSPAMRELLDLVRRIARSDTSVFITGESGSGKELVARAVHHYSRKRDKPWVDISCAALPDNLIESELFGYEKGAFSGAEMTKPGLFELAHGGTLFLDEIGELPPRMQVKLLRVLDGTPYYRLGGRRKITVDVRVLAATNRPPRQAMKKGHLRPDLYHRLSGVELAVPPLRHRPEDIVALAEFFLEQQRPGSRFSADALDVLRGYAWPGNVRELRNKVTRSALLAEDDVVGGEDLSLQDDQALEMDFPLCDLDRMERQMIRRALKQTGGHQERAAKILGISRRTLSRKLKLISPSQLSPPLI